VKEFEILHLEILNFLAGSEAIVDLAMLLLMWLRLVLLPNYVKN